MRVAGTVLALSSLASSLIHPRQEASSNSSTPVVAAAQYDGQCFYPIPDSKFDLEAYLGTWYQVAGTPFGPTTGARCVSADYSLHPNGTVRVVNKARRNGQRNVEIVGTATPVDAAYGAGGAFKVSFPSVPSPPGCPGPNYIVQDYAVDWAIVQTHNWSTPYILCRERQPPPASLEAWIDRAVAFGSKAGAVRKYNQTDCGEE